MITDHGIQIGMITDSATETKTLRQQKLEPILSVILTVSSWLCWAYMFTIPCSMVVLVPLLIGCPLLLLLLFYRFNERILTIYMLLLVAAVSAAFYQNLWDGYLTIANQMFTVINEQQGFTYLLYESGRSVGEEVIYATFALIPLLVLSSSAVVLGIRRRVFLLAFLGTAPLLAMGLFFSLRPNLPLLLILIFGWILLAVHCTVQGGGRKTLTHPFLNKKTVVLLSLAAMAVIVMVGLLLYLVLPAEKYADCPGTKAAKEHLLAFTDRLRYEKNTRIAKMPEGNFNQAQSLNYTGDPALIVMMERPRSVYLRGFTGGVYQDSRWTEVPPESYGNEFDGLFQWLRHNDFFAQTQPADLALLSPTAQHGRITIENLALSRKYIYAPYEALATGDLAASKVRFEKDNAILSKGLRGASRYTFDMYLPPVADYGSEGLEKRMTDELQSLPGYREYLDKEIVYRTFVYDTYLKVPGQVAERIPAETTAALRNQDYKNVAAAIRRYFNEEFVFSSDLEPQTENEDFMESFLEGGAGYQCHFATLAALLFRQAGIPARYVEGYYIPPWETDIYTEMTDIIFELSDYYAHAWTEIYADGHGWLPIEVTPGFYSLSEGPDELEDSGDRLKDNPIHFYISDEEAPIENDDLDEETPPERSYGLLLIIPLFLLLSALVYLLLGRRYKNKRQLSFVQADSRRAALSMYAYMARLLRAAGSKIDHHRAYKLLDEVGDQYDLSEEYTLKRFMDLVYKARFSAVGKGLDLEERSYLEEYVQGLSRTVYLRQKGHKRLLLRLAWIV